MTRMGLAREVRNERENHSNYKCCHKTETRHSDFRNMGLSDSVLQLKALMGLSRQQEPCQHF